jgi:hypothetical protein
MPQLSSALFLDGRQNGASSRERAQPAISSPRRLAIEPEFVKGMGSDVLRPPAAARLTVLGLAAGRNMKHPAVTVIREGAKHNLFWGSRGLAGP